MSRSDESSPATAPFTCEEYRDVRVEQAIADWNFESVWALLVDGHPHSPLPPAEDFPLPIRTGDHRVDMQSALAGLAPVWGFTALSRTSPEEAREGIARACVTALSFVAQSARGPDEPAVQAWVVDQVRGSARRFLTRWHGQADERFVRAIDAGWIAVAADPCCPSMRVAGLTAATGADITACLSAAVAAASGPIASGGAGRLAELLRQPSGSGAVARLREDWGLQPAAPPSASTRAAALARVAREVGSDHAVVAEYAEELANFAHPHFSTEHLLTTLWATHLFMFAGVPDRMLTAMFACGKTAGWSATILTEHTRLLEKMTT